MNVTCAGSIHRSEVQNITSKITENPKWTPRKDPLTKVSQNDPDEGIPDVYSTGVPKKVPPYVYPTQGCQKKVSQKGPNNNDIPQGCQKRYPQMCIPHKGAKKRYPRRDPITTVSHKGANKGIPCVCPTRVPIKGTWYPRRVPVTTVSQKGPHKGIPDVYPTRVPIKGTGIQERTLLFRRNVQHDTRTLVLAHTHTRLSLCCSCYY